jgi:hypothetical protein
MDNFIETDYAILSSTEKLESLLDVQPSQLSEKDISDYGVVADIADKIEEYLFTSTKYHVPEVIQEMYESWVSEHLSYLEDKKEDDPLITEESLIKLSKILDKVILHAEEI